MLLTRFLQLRLCSCSPCEDAEGILPISCRFSNQPVHSIRAAPISLRAGEFSGQETAEPGGLRLSLPTSTMDKYSQLVQGPGSNPSDFSQPSQRGGQEDMWRCSSASSQISLPAMHDASAPAQAPNQSKIDLQVCPVSAVPQIKFACHRCLATGVFASCCPL